MGLQFDWQIDDRGENEQAPSPSRRPSPWRWGLIIILALGIITGTGGYALHQQLSQSKEALLGDVQALLDQQHAAFLAGDGELFFDSFTADPAFRATQLRPEIQEMWRQGLQVTDIEQSGNQVWVSARWTASYGITYQRVLFLEQNGRTLSHIPQADKFWGKQRRSEHAWGDLIMHDADESWRMQVINAIGESVTANCTAAACGKFTVTIADDYAETAAPHQFRIPSPRLLALDENGEPANLYWFTLQKRLRAFLVPETVRFAVPASQLPIYESIARRYMELHPGRSVEIVNINSLPGSPAELLTAVDGATLTPATTRFVSVDFVTLPADASLFAAGLARDLTDYVATDPDFDDGDFYEQVWLGAWWQGRMWLMPQTAALQVIYYDTNFYAASDRDRPSLRWTWAEMEADAAALRQTTAASQGIVDRTSDMLYSYAYNQGNTCENAVTVRCNRQLRRQDVIATLTWLKRLVAEKQTPNVAELSPEQRNQLMWKLASPSSAAPAAFWIDEPIEYDNYLIQRQAGVAPFPGSDRFDGVTPLWVRGNIISAFSERPLATWHWLKFLSYQYPERISRLIPARPSVAKNASYWDGLPRPLGDAMRTAWPFARPVLIEEQGYFSGEQLTAVLTGQLSPQQAVDIRPQVTWFLQQ